MRNISRWAYQWKFNPVLTKQAQEVIFSRKLNKPVHPNLTFNNSQVSQTESQKHLGLILDNKLNFNEHLKDVSDKISKTMGHIHRKLESVQYSACLAITGTIRGTSYEKLNQELGLKTLESRQWFRKLCLFYKIANNESPSYLFDYIPITDRIYNTRNAANVPRTKSKHNSFKNSYIPATIIEWNKLDQEYVMETATLYLESTY